MKTKLNFVPPWAKAKLPAPTLKRTFERPKRSPLNHPRTKKKRMKSKKTRMKSKKKK